MKKPTRTARVPRLLQQSELAKTRGGVTAMDDWQAPAATATTGSVWVDDWLAPT